MTEGVTVSRCEACGWEGLPRRLWCPRCGSAAVGESVARMGRVEETTVLRHAVGRPDVDVPVASVRLPGGSVIIARLEGASSGDEVAMFDDAGAAVARTLDG